MAIQVQLRRGTSAQNDAFTGATGELVFDATNITVRVHDGLTAGGYMLASLAGTQTLSNKTLVSPSITTSLVTGSSTMNVFNTTATTLNIGGAATTVSIGAATGTLTINNANTVVTGNLTVNGTTTTVNSVTYTVDDPNLELNSVASPTDVNANGGGITLKGTTDKTINWTSAASAWTSSEDFNLVTGKVYEINGTSVLSATTLGSGVTGSSLTSVGTIGTGTWQGTVVGPTYGGTGVNNGSRTITLGGNLTTSGAFATTLTATGTTSVTLPTTGTLATLAGTETLTNKTIAAGSNTISGLTNSNLSGTAGITNANLANSSVTIGSTAVSLGATVTTFAGLSSVTSTTFVGALTGNAASATVLQTTRAINGVNFNGSAAITVPVNTSQRSDSVAYQIPFVTAVTAGNQNLFTDSAENLTYNPSTNTLACAGDITSPNFYSVSDERLKSNIQDSSYGLAEVMKLRSVQYDMDGRHEVGLLAQNVEEHMSEFVTTGEDGIKKLDYAKMVSVLVKTVQEQQAQIDELKSKVGV